MSKSNKTPLFTRGHIHVPPSERATSMSLVIWLDNGFLIFFIKRERVIKLFPNESSFSLRDKARMRGEKQQIIKSEANEKKAEE